MIDYEYTRLIKITDDNVTSEVSSHEDDIHGLMDDFVRCALGAGFSEETVERGMLQWVINNLTEERTKEIKEELE